MRGDNVVTDKRMTDSFKEGFAEGQAMMYGEEPMFRITVRQGGTVLVDKAVNADGAVEITRMYLLEIGGSDIGITIEPMTDEQRQEMTGLAESGNDDEVVDAELVD